MSVFPAQDYDPIFILEANFDGDEGPFWAQLEALIGETLRLMIRCCKRPADETAALYDAVTANGSRRAIAPYLEARTQRPSVFHHGNRGLSCRRITQEQALFIDAVAELDRPGPSPYRGEDPPAVHRMLREALADKHVWLDDPVPARFSLLQMIADGARFLLLLAAILAVLALPGLLLVPLGIVRPQSCWIWLLVAAGGIIVSVALLLFWVRYLERRDSTNDRPKTDEGTRREMIRREDWITQNHMGSIVLIKPRRAADAHHPGRPFRPPPAAAGNRAQRLSGQHAHGPFRALGFPQQSQPPVVLLQFRSQLDSYLDDFIEKAHVGLNARLGCGVGFPQTSYLINDGASHGRQFKAWALASRTVSRFWYSAYPDLTVDQIERNYRIALKLRKAKLGDEEAAAWMLDL